MAMRFRGKRKKHFERITKKLVNMNECRDLKYQQSDVTLFARLSVATFLQTLN